MAHLPKSYKYEDLKNPKVLDGPIWHNFGRYVFGQSMMIQCEDELYALDMVEYEGTLYIIPAKPELLQDVWPITHSVVMFVDRTIALLVEREKWFELNNEAHRMKKYSISNRLWIPN